MNVFTPERFKGESFEEYKKRRSFSIFYAKMLKRGEHPTIFVQHVNDKKNPNRKWPR